MYGTEKEKHLGGYWNTNQPWGDPGTWGPEIWNKIIKEKGITSILDVGCGKGFSCKYFSSHPYIKHVVGVEGGTNAINNTVFDGDLRHHDYTTGSCLKPGLEGEREHFDLVWCCEFVEHVEEQYVDNFLHDFAHAKYVAMTFADVGQDGYHHVNCQHEDYWIQKLEEKDYVLDREYTEELRTLARKMNEQPGFPHSGHITRVLFFKSKQM